jgi:hypothetical protein
MMRLRSLFFGLCIVAVPAAAQRIDAPAAVDRGPGRAEWWAVVPGDLAPPDPSPWRGGIFVGPRSGQGSASRAGRTRSRPAGQPGCPGHSRCRRASAARRRGPTRRWRGVPRLPVLELDLLVGDPPVPRRFTPCCHANRLRRQLRRPLCGTALDHALRRLDARAVGAAAPAYGTLGSDALTSRTLGTATRVPASASRGSTRSTGTST